ncbi:thioredoxin 1 [Fusarium tjaetaba]|uniref:Thioredoxin 1 n=1 Tax=Fusarium tjaetaba TaxID=1567544 RepID=A0A8H5SA05_9HYPO|nr:thioredoxin 1 [Fusarium tjaetaba]KAF5647863.1 thioredoxin 1 [Fusarium tjaetaba]
MPITTIHSQSEFHDLIQRHRFVIIFATATWCGPCQSIKPFFEKHANASNYDPEKLAFAQFDTDEIPALDAELGIRSIPEFFLMENAERVDNLSEANPPALKKLVDFCIWELNPSSSNDF